MTIRVVTKAPTQFGVKPEGGGCVSSKCCCSHCVVWFGGSSGVGSAMLILPSGSVCLVKQDNANAPALVVGRQIFPMCINYRLISIFSRKVQHKIIEL